MDRERTNVTLDGREYVIVPREDYDRLADLAKVANLPALPAPDAQGNYPAVGYAKVSLARKFIRERIEAGLTQRALAKLAGISFEHICRIEGGKHSPSIATITKIDGAIKRTARSRRRPGA